jgi:hypothetical protein
MSTAEFPNTLGVQLSDEEFYQLEFVQKPVDLTCPENGVHTPWLPSKAREMWRRGYSDEEIFNLLFQATRTVRHRTVTETEIRDVITLIVSTSNDSLHINGHSNAKPKAIPVDRGETRTLSKPAAERKTKLTGTVTR